MHGGFKKAVYTCKISLEFAIGLSGVAWGAGGATATPDRINR